MADQVHASISAGGLRWNRNRRTDTGVGCQALYEEDDPIGRSRRGFLKKLGGFGLGAGASLIAGVGVARAACANGTTSGRERVVYWGTCGSCAPNKRFGRDQFETCYNGNWTWEFIGGAYCAGCYE